MRITETHGEVRVEYQSSAEDTKVRIDFCVNGFPAVYLKRVDPFGQPYWEKSGAQGRRHVEALSWRLAQDVATKATPPA